MNREFLMLAKDYIPGKVKVDAWFVSEKLDGVRAWWDGGVSRGLYASEIPWANTEKDSRFLKRVTCTGLWTRYGHPIQAPDWWVDKLPKISLDGELYLGRQRFQEVVSIVKRMDKLGDWREIKYHVFEQPPYRIVLQSGRINNPNFKKEIDWVACESFLKTRGVTYMGYPRLFADVIDVLMGLESDVIVPVKQVLLNNGLSDKLDGVVGLGGEGLMLRNPVSFWDARRSPQLLKMKRVQDSEATVMGYTWGEGKYYGMMGSMIVKWRDRIFELSGFTDVERELTQAKSMVPHSVCENSIKSIRFPIGSTVTFSYREVTNDGLPKEARYLRKRDNL